MLSPKPVGSPRVDPRYHTTDIVLNLPVVGFELDDDLLGVRLACLGNTGHHNLGGDVLGQFRGRVVSDRQRGFSSLDCDADDSECSLSLTSRSDVRVISSCRM